MRATDAAAKRAGETESAESSGFSSRHIGLDSKSIRSMLEAVGHGSLEALAAAAVPEELRLSRPLKLGPALGEEEAFRELEALAAQNEIYRSYIGMGYYETILPAAIRRGILENPGWYTPYTPYQAEISQGRLEALLNFQTMIEDLTGLPVSNASLLDEATAAAESMTLCLAAHQGPEAPGPFFAGDRCHPQTLAVLRTRAAALGIELVVSDPESWDFGRKPVGVLIQYPETRGGIPPNIAEVSRKAHEAGALTAVACDLLALTLLKPPGDLGADIALGSAQRFGVPLGYGGPHAAFFATRKEHQRLIPGRIVGVSKDGSGRPALRLALQTREQHIRREKATSNICTAQALLAVIASFYAVYHGPEGLKRIALRIRRLASALALGLQKLGYRTGPEPFFDTVLVEASPSAQKRILAAAERARVNLREVDEGFCVSMDEAASEADVERLLRVFAAGKRAHLDVAKLLRAASGEFEPALRRAGAYLTHPVFNSFRSETELMRYMKRLENRDVSLVHSMIPLGSCTMKLNSASEMRSLDIPSVTGLHPFVPAAQAKGWAKILEGLADAIKEITGFDAVSFQPNAGSQGEYTGLMAIRRYHESRGEGRRRVCLIPRSAHGTNPASAAAAGFSAVPVETTSDGSIDREDLKRKIAANSRELAAIMITYPSTHGVFEEGLKEICRLVHEAGGQVYLDGANLNALVGLCRVGEVGADVCHLNLHKTFCIPHGGGGPGMGPIAADKHLAPFMPRHPLARVGARDLGAVSAAPFGSASILPIAWLYIRQLGGEGLTRATQAAILSANYVARRLSSHYPLLYRGRGGLIAHECLLDLRAFKDSAGVTVEDVAKRLMDYGFHAPTVSWPVAGTLMIEPTESESKEEIDRFVDAMILIRGEIRDIEAGRSDRTDNPLKNAPHTALMIASDDWRHPYGRDKAAFPAPWTRERKFWPFVGRIDNAYGDRNLVCACPPWN